MEFDEWLQEQRRQLHERRRMEADGGGGELEPEPDAEQQPQQPQPELQPEPELEPEPEPELAPPRVSTAEAARRICLVASSISGAENPPPTDPPKLPAVPYSHAAHLRLLQSQADAQIARARAEDGGLTEQQLVGRAARGDSISMHALLDEARSAEEKLAELRALKESIALRIDQIAAEDHQLAKDQAELVEQRQEVIAQGEAIARARQQAEAVMWASQAKLEEARANVGKLSGNQLGELRAMRKPAPSVLVTAEALCILLREAEPAELKHKWQKWRWEEGQLLLKAGRRLKSRLKSLDLGSLSAPRVQAARRRLAKGEVSAVTITKMSVICRPLARYLLVAVEAWQASHDLQQSLDEQVVANRRYDANARAIAALEERAEGNRARVAEMRAELDRQMSLQQEVEDASAAASSRKEKSDRTMREANWVKPICDAIRHRHWKQLRSILDQDLFSSAAGFYRGMTPLHVAAEHDNANAATALLQHGGAGLMLQSWYDPESVYDWLVQKKKRSVRKPQEGEEEGEDDDGGFGQRVPLAMVMELALDAVVRRHTDLLSEILAAPASSLLELDLVQPGLRDMVTSRANFPDEGVSLAWFEAWWAKARPTRTPLFVAASHGHRDTVHAMLTECDRHATIGRGLSWGPDIARAFHTAVWRGHTDVVESFGELHSLDFRQALDTNSYTAMWNACRVRDGSMVRCLHKIGCDVSDGGVAAGLETPLHLSARIGCAQTIQALKESGGSLQTKDASGGTPCHSACRAGEAGVVEAVYDELDASGEVTDRMGRTSLDVALGQRHLMCCAQVLRVRHNRRLRYERSSPSMHYAASLPMPCKAVFGDGDGVLHIGEKGWSLLHAAAHQGLVGVAEFVLQESVVGSSLQKSARDFQLACSWTPLMLAVIEESDSPKMLRLLIDAGSDVHARNEEGWDALWLASNGGKTRLVALLLAEGADPWLNDLQGVNCLMAAALAGHIETSQLLIDAMFGGGQQPGKHADVMGTLSTVLFCGLMESDADLVSTTLALGVDANKCDAFGCTAAQHAVGHECDEEVLRLLARHGAELWHPPKTAGIEILKHLDAQLDLLHMDAEHQACVDFLTELESSLQRLAASEPAWVGSIVKHIQAPGKRVKEKTATTIVSKLQMSPTGRLEIVHSEQEGTYLPKEKEVTPKNVASKIATVRLRLQQIAQSEDVEVQGGQRAYKLSLHFYIVTDILGAEHTFHKRPALLLQRSSQIDPLQRTPLIVAAQLGKADWVRVLLEPRGLTTGARKRIIDARDIHGRSALHAGVESGIVEIVELLVAARPALLEGETKVGRTARELALSCRKETQKALKKVRVIDWWSGEPIVAAGAEEKAEALLDERRRRVEILEILARAGARSNNARRVILVGRYCRWVVWLPWGVLHTLYGLALLTFLAPTLRESPVLMANVIRSNRNATGFLLALVLGLASAILVSGVAGQLVVQRIVVGCIGLAVLTQLVATCRILSAEGRLPPRTSTPLFQTGWEWSSFGWVLALLLELPQQAALAFVASAAGKSWRYPLLDAELFGCVDHEDCLADLSPVSAGGRGLSCEVDFCPSCEHTGACDSACGVCAETTTSFWTPDTVTIAIGAVAAVWLMLSSTIVLSMRLSQTPRHRTKLPPIRADAWQPRSRHLWLHFFCHTAYLPVVWNLLRVTDCRAVESAGSAAAGEPRPEASSGAGPLVDVDDVTWGGDGTPWWSDWQASHQWRELECWRGEHRLWVLASAALLLGFQLCTGVLPLLIRPWLAVAYGSATVAVPPAFDAVSRTIKLCMVLVAVAAASAAPTLGLKGHLTVTCGACAGNLLLAAATVLWPPSEHASLKRLRFSIYCAAAGISATAALSVLLCSEESVVDRYATQLLVHYSECQASHIALATGLLLGAAASYFALESLNGLPPFVRALGRASRKGRVAPYDDDDEGSV